MKPPTRRIAAKPSRRPSEPIEREDASVSVYGELHGELTQIRASSVRLVLTFGEYADGRDVLVPLVDWQTFGHKVSEGVEPKPEEKGTMLSSRLLTFDNMAFLLQDLSYDTRDAVRLLVAQCRNGVEPVEDRTRYASRMLRLAAKHLTGAAEQMDGLLDQRGGDEARSA